MYLVTLFLSLTLQPVRHTPSCETIGPRLDATYVTICDGRVTRVTDRAPTTFTYLAPESR